MENPLEKAVPGSPSARLRRGFVRYPEGSTPRPAVGLRCESAMFQTSLRSFSVALLFALLLPLSSASAQVPGVSREQMWWAPTEEDWKKPCLVSCSASLGDVATHEGRRTRSRLVSSHTV